MFRQTRTLHRWTGVVLAIFFIIIAVTGLLLATKSTLGWIRPPEANAEKVESLAGVVSVDAAAQAAFAQNLPELKTAKDIDRIDYRPKLNIYKVLSKEGYHEVQVDGKTGKVIQVSQRVDQLAEDIHDLSFFSDALSKYGLPIVALGLLTLSISGIAIWAVPVLRKRKYLAEKTKVTRSE
jgi:uncharacterized iron-regulated membrane protein